jgi:hypothetical protein
MQEERLKLDVDVVVLLQLLDLDEADVAPRSNEVRDDDDRRAFSLDFCFSHALSIRSALDSSADLPALPLP